MAVTKLWSVTERLGQVIDYATNPEKTSAKIKREFSPEQYQALADVIAYAKDEEKTEREFYVEGINCNVAIARDQFITVKEQYQKTDGIQAYHGYLSFKETDISPEMAQKIGMEFANEVWGKRFQSRCDNPPEHKAPALSFCHQLYFFRRWETFMGRGKSVVQIPKSCRQDL